MSIAIKPVAANLIRQVHERYPDLPAADLAKKGNWTYGQVKSALSKKAPDRLKSRAMN